MIADYYESSFGLDAQQPPYKMMIIKCCILLKRKLGLPKSKKDDPIHAQWVNDLLISGTPSLCSYTEGMMTAELALGTFKRTVPRTGSAKLQKLFSLPVI